MPYPNFSILYVMLDIKTCLNKNISPVRVVFRFLILKIKISFSFYLFFIFSFEFRLQIKDK